MHSFAPNEGHVTGSTDQDRECVALVRRTYFNKKNTFIQCSLESHFFARTICSMGFCMLVVCGLNKLASVVGYNGKPFSEDKVTDEQSNNRNGTKRSLNSPPKVTSCMLHKVLLSGVFVLIGLFCWKSVVRNRVWSSRETLFRYIQQ